MISRAAGPDRVTQRIESARFLAVTMLVFYHVVGSEPSGGLQIPTDHPLRFVMDLLVDIRMPLFACIAGYVYALRPVEPRDLGRFLTGKMRRLAVPGAFAILCFMISAHLGHTRFAAEAEWWRNFILPYAHYWFLQAILVIFFVYGSFDILTKGRWLWPSLAGAVLWYLWGPILPINLMSVNKAFYLLPYFVIGIVLFRQTALIDRHARSLLLICLAVAVMSLSANLLTWHETGRLSQTTRDLQSLTIGISVTAILLLSLPVIPLLRGFGPVAFTIYLYHVFGTSLMRRGLDHFGVDDLVIQLVLGIVAGFAVPWVVHSVAGRFALGKRLVLGARRTGITT